MLSDTVKCPTCDAPAERAHMAGRTTWWLCSVAKCPQETWGTTPPVHTSTHTTTEG